MYIYSKALKVSLVLVITGAIVVYALTIMYYSTILRDRESEINILKKRVEDLENTKLSLSRRINDLTFTVIDLNNTIAELLNQRRELERNISSLNKRIRELEVENSMLSRELSSLKRIVELRENTTLIRLTTSFTLRYYENKSFTYNLRYSGYFILRIVTEEENIVLKITIRGNYSGQTYMYEYTAITSKSELNILLPVLPGNVELTIMNSSYYRTVTILKLEVIYIY